MGTNVTPRRKGRADADPAGSRHPRNTRLLWEKRGVAGGRAGGSPAAPPAPLHDVPYPKATSNLHLPRPGARQPRDGGETRDGHQGHPPATKSGRCHNQPELGMSGKGARRGTGGPSVTRPLLQIRQRKRQDLLQPLPRALPHARPVGTTGPPAALPAPRAVAAFGGGQRDPRSAPNALHQRTSPPSPGEGTPKSFTVLPTRRGGWALPDTDTDTVPNEGRDCSSTEVGPKNCSRGFSSSSHAGG